jgi:IPT/TIG domain
MMTCLAVHCDREEPYYLYSMSTSSQDISMGWVSGSVQGGTRLYLKGLGFSRISPKSNQVYIGAYPCNVIEFLTTSTQIVCETTAAPQGDYPVTVRVNGNNVAVCKDSWSWCMFHYHRENTPRVYGIRPLSASPNQRISFYTQLISRSTESLRGAMIGDDQCDFSDEDDMTGLEPWWVINLFCRIPQSKTAGYFNVSLHVDGNAGTASESLLATQLRFYKNDFNNN